MNADGSISAAVPLNGTCALVFSAFGGADQNHSPDHGKAGPRRRGNRCGAHGGLIRGLPDGSLGCDGGGVPLKEWAVGRSSVERRSKRRHNRVRGRDGARAYQSGDGRDEDSTGRHWPALFLAGTPANPHQVDRAIGTAHCYGRNAVTDGILASRLSPRDATRPTACLYPRNRNDARSVATISWDSAGKYWEAQWVGFYRAISALLLEMKAQNRLVSKAGQTQSGP